MATVLESSGAKPPLAASLAEGVKTTSNTQSVVFTLYVKVILPLDGYVFWVNSTLLTPAAIAAAIKYSGTTYATPPANSITVLGSLHRSVDLLQEEDVSRSANHVIFTSLRQVPDFNAVSPNIMYVANLNGVRFAFNRQDNFYIQSDLYHYRGDAIYSTMATQLIDTMAGFDTSNVIVSNSLPAWLSLNKYFTVYPSYLVPQGTLPPYAVAHIEPGSTKAMQAAPRIDLNGSHFQCVTETVRITMYGVRNAEALAYQDYVNNYSLTGNFGISNMPVIRDEKVPQSEYSVISMKKVIEYDINYFQQNIAAVAQQLIASALISITPS